MQTALKQIPDLYAQDALGENAIAYLKFTKNDWTWYATEYDREESIFFGLVFGFETEWGYFSLSELTENGCKRDFGFEPTAIADIRKLHCSTD